MKQKLSERAVYQPGTAELTANSTFKQLADYWLADMDMNPDRAEGLASFTAGTWNTSSCRISQT